MPLMPFAPFSMKTLLLVLASLLITGCVAAEPREPTTQELIDDLHRANTLMGECVTQRCRELQ